MKNFKIGDKVIADMPYGYAPVHGVIVNIYVNGYGKEIADVYYGPEGTNYRGAHRHVTVNSLKEWN